MVELLFLLLPLAFYSGWNVARKQLKKKTTKDRQLSGHFVKGVNYLLNEEPDKALEVFLNYPDIDEYTAETYHLLGNLFRNRGEVDRALRVHQNLIARANLSNSQKQKAMYSLGQDFFSAGMLDRAESVFHELLDSNISSDKPSKAAVCQSLRIIYEQTQEWDKAIEAVECYKKHRKKEEDKSSDQNSLVSHYYCELADESLQQGNLHDVDQYLTKAKKAKKNATRILSLQGDVALHQHQHKLAYKHYLAAIKQNSHLTGMLFNKLEISANKTNDISGLQKQLLKLYKVDNNKTVFEKILYLAKKHQLNSKTLDKMIHDELSNNKLNIASIYYASDYMSTNLDGINSDEGLKLIHHALKNYLQGTPAFHCTHCGYKMHDFLWRCPACHHWDTIQQN